ncbi:MAG: sigma-70 family RNA polymerase sigma factor [Myxococcota bacterium]
MTDSEELKRWMIQLRDGDREAFEPVYRALWPLVRDFAARAGGADGQDVAQQALLRLFERSADYDEQHRVEAWALSITAWEIRTARKRRSRRREVSFDAAPPSVTEHPEDALIRRCLAEEATRVLGQLRPADRDTLQLAFGEEAESMSANLRKRKQRALARLRQAWRSIHE